MLIFGTLSLIPLAIIVFGAYHVWLTITHGLGKLLNHWEEARIKTWAAGVIAVSILVMLTPLLIPTSGVIRDVFFGMYLLYAGTTVVHVIRWWTARHQSPDAQAKKDDNNGK
jgi:hypothetical protein